MTVTAERPIEPPADALELVWEDRPGIPGFLSTVDHKRIGARYFVTAFAFLLIGGVQALLIRMQLAGPERDVLGPETYNQLMTMHGTTMIFLFNTPMMAAFGNYLVPLQIGARDMAFPRVNALSYWIFLFAGVFMYSSFLVGEVPDGGWFAYVPLTGDTYSPGKALDFWGLGVVFLGLSTTAGAVNFIVTIFRLRAPGMALSRMPLFVWAILVMSFMVLFALPAITLAPLLNELDRLFGTAFFVPGLGGDPVLYQHLFWIWGHPEVYILFVPAVGIVSMVVPVFARRRIAGYALIVATLVATGFISFGVWVHHMFAVGMPAMVNSFFSAASLIIAIPSGIQIFAWLATIWDGRPVFRPPLLFSIGFVVVFVIGGITGVMVAVVPFDLQVHDSYFVVAHFHYVLIGGVVFPVFAGLYHWFPKITGRMPSDRLGHVSFWLMLVGMNVTFFPMHVLGFLGMPRRVYTYQEGLGWGSLNLLISAGAVVFAAGVVVTAWNLTSARWRGAAAGADPWAADSLEWAVSSPPPHYNFGGIPVVVDRHPLWAPRQPAIVTEVDGDDLVRPGAPHHETLGSRAIDADGIEVLPMPGPSYAPLVVALALAGLAAGVLAVSPWIASAAAGVLVAGVAWWQWGAMEEAVPTAEGQAG